MMKTKYADRLIVLREYDNAIEAHIARGVLQSNGVACVLTNENMSSVYPMTPAGEVELLVRSDDAELAERILNDANDSLS